LRKGEERKKEVMPNFPGKKKVWRKISRSEKKKKREGKGKEVYYFARQAEKKTPSQREGKKKWHTTFFEKREEEEKKKRRVRASEPEGEWSGGEGKHVGGEKWQCYRPYGEEGKGKGGKGGSLSIFQTKKRQKREGGKERRPVLAGAGKKKEKKKGTIGVLSFTNRAAIMERGEEKGPSAFRYRGREKPLRVD